MKAPSTIVVVVLGSVLLIPSSAAAQRCSGEDLAAIDQYCELVPGVTGKLPLSRSKQALGTVLSPAARERFMRSGPEGRALLALPVGAPLGQGSPRPLPGAADALEGSLGEHPGFLSRGTEAVGNVLNGAGGVSDIFRWALLLSTVGLSGTAWVRHRR